MTTLTDHVPSPARYAAGCRCRPCTDVAVREDTKRRLERLAGNPREMPIGPVLEHLRALLARPMSYGQIAHASGVGETTIRKIHVDNHKTVNRRNGARLLAVPLTGEITSGMVPSIGATRRVRALYALGHFSYRIAAECGMSRDAISELAAGKWQTIDYSRLQAVRRVYDRLSMSTDTSWKARKLAEKNGWAPPLAWDEDTIDDPTAEPVLDATEPEACTSSDAVARWLMGESVILGAAGRREAVAYLMEWSNQSADQIGERLGMEGESVRRLWERIKARARETGQPAPWRRVYLPPARKTGAVGGYQKAA